MATSAVALKTGTGLSGPDSDETQKSQIINGTATVGAGNYVTNGLPLAWNILNVAGNPILPQSNSLTPYNADFFSIAGSGYTYQFDKAHGTLRVFLGGTELTNGAAVPAAVTGDVISFRAWFAKA